jgi:hypothetical protein
MAVGAAVNGVFKVVALGMTGNVIQPTYYKTQTTLDPYGVHWYNYGSNSFGFSLHSSISLNSADTEISVCNYRLSWHMQGSGGYRAGCNTDPDASYRKMVLYGACFSQYSLVVTKSPTKSPTQRPTKSPTKSQPNPQPRAPPLPPPNGPPKPPPTAPPPPPNRRPPRPLLGRPPRPLLGPPSPPNIRPLRPLLSRLFLPRFPTSSVEPLPRLSSRRFRVTQNINL